MTLPLIARLAADPQTPTADGRWTLNSGALVTTVIRGLNNDKPIRLVVELSTLRLPGKVVALADHTTELYSVLGSWGDLRVDAAGLTAVPVWLAPEATGYTASLVVGMVKAGVPLRASIGFQTTAAPDSVFARLMAAETVNGQLIDPRSDPLPTYVGRNLELTEASVVLFGADSHTGAAGTFARTATPTTPEPPMLTAEALKGILKDHPNHKALCAELQADGHDETAIRAKLRQAESEAQAAALKASQDENATLKAQLTAKDSEIGTLKAKLKQDSGSIPGPGHQTGDGGGGEAPVTMQAALTKHGDDPAFKGMPMPQRMARLRRLYPALP
jgi:hypothetical protein